MAAAQPGRISYHFRPNLVVVDGCERMLIADITVANSVFQHLVTRNVNDLTIERVKIRTPYDGSAPETKGITSGPGKNLWIHDCDIETGAAAISVKPGGTNVLIENITVRGGDGITIGPETQMNTSDMLVRHCMIEDTDAGVRIWSMRGAGGVVQNVRYTDIRMKNVANAIVIHLDAVKNDGDDKVPTKKGAPAKVPVIRDIQLDHFIIEGSRNAGVIFGQPYSKLTNITLQDITLAAQKDFETRDADVVFERVTRNISPGER